MPLNWKNFVQNTKDRKPHKLLTDTLETLEIPKGIALDIGCGPGVDAKYLAEKGFAVEVIDSSEDSVKQTSELCEGLNVKVIHDSINDFVIEPETYSLIFSWNTLPYLQKKEAESVLRKSYEGLVKNGVLIFSVFGSEDDWVKNMHGIFPALARGREMNSSSPHSLGNKQAESFFTLEEIKNIFGGAEIIKAEEVKEQKVMPSGKTKFWHLLKFVIKK